jgi:glutathione gamma-glutamylcysteinyltransferase
MEVRLGRYYGERVTTSATLYRRPLPADLVAFSSPEGRAIFREALAAGTLEGWFVLAEQYHTQADPAFCGLGSLVVALNGLGIDPQRLWKGPWRWFSEELLDCCVSLDVVRTRGINLIELGCLARCNGVAAEVHHASDDGLEALRATIEGAAKGDGSVVIAAYDRAVLGQTGSGHYSPIGGFHAERDLALLLDVARFKYPPHWVSIERLHHAMAEVDRETGRSRGWLALRRRSDAGGLLASIVCSTSPWKTVAEAFAGPSRRWKVAPPRTLEDTLAAFAAEVAPMIPYFQWREPLDAAHAELASRLRTALRESPVGRALAPHAGEMCDLAAACFYALDATDFAPLSELLRQELASLTKLESVEPALRPELTRVRDQLAALRAYR